MSGTLLITPNAVMFDPNVSDPLVIEQGAESYGVILPLELIIQSGIYSDIAMMMVEQVILFWPKRSKGAINLKSKFTNHWRKLTI